MITRNELTRILLAFGIWVATISIPHTFRLCWFGPESRAHPLGHVRTVQLHSERNSLHLSSGEDRVDPHCASYYNILQSVVNNLVVICSVKRVLSISKGEVRISKTFSFIYQKVWWQQISGPYICHRVTLRNQRLTIALLTSRLFFSLLISLCYLMSFSVCMHACKHVT